MKHIRYLHQYDSMQCGITCLQMICEYYGKRYSLSFLEKLCTPTTEGISLLGLSKAANYLGFDTICTQIDITNLSKYPLPCILHWNQNHFVILYKIRRDKRFYIADPSKGLIKYNLEEFKSHWISTRLKDKEQGIAMLCSTTQLLDNNNIKEETKLKEERLEKPH